MATKTRGKKRYWLMKSEPSTYSFDDLLRDGTTPWDGVRNYQARNLLRDEVKKGDRVLFYHSSANPPHVAGVAEVTREGHPDVTALDAASPYFDAKSTPDEPRWYVVTVKPVRKLERAISLAELKENPKLDGMLVIKKGQRLSVQLVDKAHYDEVLKMAKRKQA